MAASTTPCASCGAPLPPGARFCNACGAQQAPTFAGGPPSSSRPAANKVGARRVVDVESPMASRPPSPVPSGVAAASDLHPGFAPAPVPPAAPARPAFAGTMIGIPGVVPGQAGQAPPIPPPSSVAPPQVVPAPIAPSPVAPVPAAPKGIPKGTMLGVAMPGVAPTRSHVPAAAPLPAYVAPPAYAPPPAYASPPAYAPPPAHAPPPAYAPSSLPSHGDAEERASLAPGPVAVARPSRALPVLFGVLAVGAVAVTAVLLSRSSGPPLLTSSVEGDASAPKLTVRCAACGDGSALELGGKSVTFEGGAVTLALSAGELKAGHNPLRGTVTPKGGKPANVQLDVVVPYFVRPSLAPLAKGEARVDLVFDLADDVSAVTIDGAALDLDKKVYALAVAPPAEDGKSFDRTVTYEVSTKAGALRGSLKVGIPYAPLRLGLPGRKPWAIAGVVELSGKTSPGATVAFGDARVTADDAGIFKGKAKVAADQKDLEVRAYGGKLAPRASTVPLLHAATPDDVQKAGRADALKLSLAKIADKPEDHAGKVVAFALEVAQVGEEDGRAVAVGDAKCEALDGKCPTVKVLVAQGVSLAKGDVVDGLGVVVRSIASEKTKTSALELDAFWMARKK